MEFDVVYLSNLFDYYGCLLTDKQREYFEFYYFENLTISEIAENTEVSKNAVSKSLIETKEKLEYYESKLHLVSNKDKIVETLDSESVDKIIDFI